MIHNYGPINKNRLCTAVIDLRVLILSNVFFYYIYTGLTSLMFVNHVIEVIV